MLETTRHSTRAFTEMEGTYRLPEDVLRPEYVMPDEVVQHCIQSLGLTLPNMRGIDPMCGNGTIVKLINEQGGCCDGIELDRWHYEKARDTVPLGRLPADNGLTDLGSIMLGATVPAGEIVHGDCVQTLPPSRDRSGQFYPYHYVYTSVPFDEVLSGRLDDRFALTFDRLLMEGGYLIIDSADEAVRNGSIVNPAEPTVEYFERLGFKLIDRVGFRFTNTPPGCDDQFTELLFARRSEAEMFPSGMLSGNTTP